MFANAWRCVVPIPRPRTRYFPGLQANVVLDQSACDRCGVPNDMHPIDICCECPHMVRKHGANTDGCGNIGAAGWCACLLTFDRAEAEFVKWA